MAYNKRIHIEISKTNTVLKKPPMIYDKVSIIVVGHLWTIPGMIFPEVWMHVIVVEK